mgnify:CR=1 FL=1
MGLGLDASTCKIASAATAFFLHLRPKLPMVGLLMVGQCHAQGCSGRCVMILLSRCCPAARDWMHWRDTRLGKGHVLVLHVQLLQSPPAWGDVLPASMAAIIPM